MPIPDREVFPIEVSVSDGADGRPQVRGWAGLTIPGYQISSATARHLGVAIARPAAHRGVPGAGIGVAEIGGDPKLAPLPDLSGPELAVLDQVLLDRALQHGAFQLGAFQYGAVGDAAGPAAERLVWLARFAAAREAAAKALGTAGADQPAGRHGRHLVRHHGARPGRPVRGQLPRHQHPARNHPAALRRGLDMSGAARPGRLT